MPGEDPRVQRDADGRVQHKLHDTWTLWLEKREILKAQLTEHEWDKGLQKVGVFETIEQFFCYYSHMVRVSELPNQMSYYMFRGSTKPTWENYPHGGHWTVTLTKSVDGSALNRLWEQLIFAMIGEGFDTPHVVGVAVSVRRDGYTLSVWSDSNTVKFTMGGKFKETLNLGVNVMFDYKNNLKSLKDASGRGGESYVIKGAGSGQAAEEAPAD
eukprot:TRINITY_DN2393_c0_g1_i1.p1 TRINITY_DN2393_c0_g1~~TRINITY_DN2393_c0_g1_i1.p1  ORF type:complete len:238 (+),score=80.55 TRINITY_DN2393_c0_g1_i1:77-715(+)